MANDLSAIIGDVYKAAERVGQQLVGVIPSVTINAGSEAAAQGATVTSFVTPEPVVNSSASPSMAIPEGDDQTITANTMTVNQIASVRIPWTGEDTVRADSSFGYETIQGRQVERAMRKIVDQIEAYLATAAKKGASRAVGTAGTTPFGSDFGLVADVRKVLADNGMFAEGEVSLVMDTFASTNLRKLAQLQKANEAGGTDLLRRGTLLDLQGIMLKESAGIGIHTKGTGASYQSNNASGYTAGTTTIALDTGSGTVLAGDVVTFTGDTNKYVVNVALSGGSVVLGKPGLRTTLADNVGMTVGNNYTANLAILRSAVELVMRPLVKPPGGDAAADETIVQDPVSGLVFRLSLYKGYNKSMLDITCLYDAKVWNSDGVAILMG